MDSTLKTSSTKIPLNVWIILISDLCALVLSCVLAYLVRLTHAGLLPLGLYLDFAPLLIIFPLLFAFMGLYPGFFTHPAEELKKCFLGASAGFLILASAFFLTKQGDSFSRAFILMAWFFSIILIPFFRHRLRAILINKSWWNIPIIIMSEQGTVDKIKTKLMSRLIPLKPVALIAPEKYKSELDIENYFLEPGKEEEIIKKLASKWPNALIVMDAASFRSSYLDKVLDILSEYFTNIISLADVSWDYCIPTRVYNIGGSFALAIRRNLANNKKLKLKRATDLFFSITGGLLIFPFFLLVIILIRMNSKGPALFKQKRIGLNGQEFKVYKFRTMVEDAEKALEKFLKENPEYQAEWDENHKLKKDPRITSVGKILRKTSLDELPQILNVIKGEMSLVGPRPIVESEIEKYGGIFQMYSHVRPGITGLWQVTGRSDTSYEERVTLDRYYVANWSFWLDIYILLKTIPAVLGKKGAY